MAKPSCERSDETKNEHLMKNMQARILRIAEKLSTESEHMNMQDWSNFSPKAKAAINRKARKMEQAATQLWKLSKSFR